MTKTHRKTTDEPCAAAGDAFTSGRERPSQPLPERERQMAELRIGYDGLQYQYNGYRYDRLADAVAYATLMRSRPTQQDAGGTFTQRKTHAAPTDAERALMATLAIGFEDGAYRFEGFRYDGLSDALSYAKLMHQQREGGGPRSASR